MPEIVGSLRPPRLSTPPPSPARGEIYYDVDDDKLYWWNGTTWVPSGAVSGTATVYDTDEIGTIKAFSGATIPANWMLADGRSLLRGDYPQLFAAIGTTFGSVDGTHFNLPDLRGKFILGANSSSTQGATGGTTAETLSVGQIPSHSHGGATGNDSPDHTHSASTTSTGAHLHALTAGTAVYNDLGAFASGIKGGTGAANINATVITDGAHSHTITVGGASARHTHSISPEGGGGSHNNMPPYIEIAQIIKITGVTVNSGAALVGATGATGLAGAKGDPGPWRGAWSAATAYVVGDSVSYFDGTVTGSYRRKVAGTTAGDPKTDTTNWEIIASGGSVGANGYTPSSKAHSAGFTITNDSNARIYTPALTIDHNELGITTFGSGYVSIPAAGRYLVGFTLSEVAQGTIQIAMIVSDASVPRRVTLGTVTGADGSKGGTEIWDLITLAAGATLKLVAFSTGGGSTNVLTVEIIRLDASSPTTGIPLVTTLPASPINGQEVYYQVDAANGIIWHLRYNAASASAYKWEYLGGPPLRGYYATNENIPTTWSSGQPSITIPRAGEYDVDWSCEVNSPGQSQNYIAFYLDAVRVDAIVSALFMTANPQGATGAERNRVAIAAGQVVSMGFVRAGAAVSSAKNRSLMIKPVRIS